MTDINFPLEGDALRNFLLHSGQKLVTAFDSGAATLDFLRDNGMKIRTADFYDIRRAVQNMTGQADYLAKVSGDSLIPLAQTATTHGWELSQNFLYKLKVDGTSPTTGESITKYFAISSDRQLTPNEAADILGGMLVGEDEFYEITADGFSVVGALAQPGLW